MGESGLLVQQPYPMHIRSFVCDFFKSSMKMCFDSDNPVTFRLIEGNGPVHIAAEHVVGMYVLMNYTRSCTV